AILGRAPPPPPLSPRGNTGSNPERDLAVGRVRCPAFRRASHPGLNGNRTGGPPLIPPLEASLGIQDALAGSGATVTARRRPAPRLRRTSGIVIRPGFGTWVCGRSSRMSDRRR